MNSLHGLPHPLRAETIQLSRLHTDPLQTRSVTVEFGMPYETLLGVICHSVQNARAVGQLFRRLHAVDAAATGRYLTRFVERLLEELDFGDPSLRAKAGYRDTPMDFVRPTPTRGFTLPAFCAELSALPDLAELMAKLPLRASAGGTASPFAAQSRA